MAAKTRLSKVRASTDTERAGPGTATAAIRKLRVRDSSLHESSCTRFVEAIARIRILPAGTVLVEERQRPGESTVILEGWAARYIRTARNGAEQILTLNLPGDFIDLQSFPLKVLDHGVRCLTTCRVAAVPHQAIRAITETDPHLTRVLWLQTLVDAAISRQRLFSMAQRTALEHAAHLICELFTRLRVIGYADEYSFELPLTQEQLASTIGLSTVHMNRVLQQLRKRELITWQRGTVHILKWDDLQSLASFDPAYLSLHDEPR